jgi:pimeloyl-ACP methyl ester carboxylesterase
MLKISSVIIGNRNDPARYYEKRWESLFPDASRTVVRNGYHFPMCDDPDLFASSLNAWWAQSTANNHVAHARTYRG